jgi:hypothetical protein
MIGRRKLRRVALIALLGPVIAGCSEIIPDLSLRDDYTGKSILQPGRVPATVERDALGNPILTERRFPNTITFRFLDPFQF